MSASSPDKDDFRPKLQMEKHYEQSYIPLTEKGVFERIELPSLLNLYSKTSMFYWKESKLPQKFSNNYKVGKENQTTTVAYCTCDLASTLPDIIAGAGTTYSSLGLPANYVLTNKCLKILGVLIIDMNVTFEGGSILTGGTTKIIVESGNTLSIKDVNEDEGIHSFECEVLWKGIEVENDATLNISNSLIQDAFHSVSLLNGSTHRIQNTQFRRNLVGIIVPSGQTPPVVINQSAPLTGNLFDSYLLYVDYLFTSVYLLPYFDGGVFTMPDKPYAGIEIHDATYIVGSPSSGSAANEFRLVENGIIGVGANLAIYDVEMDQMNETPQAINSTPIRGFGVHTHTTLTRVERSDFDGVTTGIGVISPIPSSFIGTNTFNDNYVGVSGLNGSIIINDNVFTEYLTRAVNLDGSSGLVNENEFNSPNASPLSVGVAWSNNPGLTSGSAFAGQVEDNTFNAGVDGMGVQLSNCSNFRIQDNVVNYLAGSSAPPPTGIILSASSNNEIRYNQVIGASSSSLPAFGVRTFTSTNNLYCCNTLDNLRGAMAFSGACNGSKIKYNEFGNTGNSSFLCGAGTLIGSQSHYKNTWTGTFSSPPPSGIAHSKHDGSLLLIQSSIFEVNTCLAPLFPPTILPAQSCPSSIDWFRFSANSGVTNCGNDLDCADSGEGGEEGLIINDNDMRYLNGDYTEEEYDNMIEWQMGKDLYQKLLRDNDLIGTHEDVTNFYNSSQNSALGQFVQINETLKEAGSMTEITKIALDAILNEMESFMTDLGNIDSQMLEDLSPEEFTDLSNERNAVLEQITALQSELSDLMAAHRTSAQSSYYSLAGINSSINATTDIEIMEKDVNALLIQSLIDPSYVFNEEENEYLFSLANLCHLHYGSVVFTARVLYLRTENYHFDDDAICFPEPEMKKSQDDKSIINSWNVSIVPNPASNILNISWKNENSFNNELTINLMDLQGKVVMTTIVPGELEITNLDVSNLSSGVYLLQGNDKFGVQFTEKVIIKK